MGWDEAFFAHSEIELLMWDEDPSDHPLLATVPHFLITRAKKIVSQAPFATRRTTTPKGVRISVVRKGRRRATVPLRETA